MVELVVGIVVTLGDVTEGWLEWVLKGSLPETVSRAVGLEDAQRARPKD